MGHEGFGKAGAPEDPAALYSGLKAELDALHESPRRLAARSLRAKRRLWLDGLQAAGMAPEGERRRTRLFLAHSLLIVIVRMAAQTLAGTRRTDAWKSALGDGFASWVLDCRCGAGMG